MSGNHARIIAACRRLALLSGSPDDVLDVLAAKSFLQAVPAGTEVIAQNETVGYIYGIVSGSVEAIAEHGGLQTLMYVVPAGRCFVYSAAVLSTRSFASFVTTEPCELVMIPAETLREAATRDPALGFALTRELAITTDLAAREILNQKLRSASERLAALLLREQLRHPDSNIVDLPLSKRKTAQRLGATPETLSRILANLRAVGVETDGNRYIINDVEALRAFAKPSPVIDGMPW